jgi:hypothetical protein
VGQRAAFAQFVRPLCSAFGASARLVVSARETLACDGGADAARRGRGSHGWASDGRKCRSFRAAEQVTPARSRAYGPGSKN